MKANAIGIYNWQCFLFFCHRTSLVLDDYSTTIYRRVGSASRIHVGSASVRSLHLLFPLVVPYIGAND